MNPWNDDSIEGNSGLLRQFLPDENLPHPNQWSRLLRGKTGIDKRQAEWLLIVRVAIIAQRLGETSIKTIDIVKRERATKVLTRNAQRHVERKKVPCLSSCSPSFGRPA
jgi:hypothetical protein